MAAHDNSDGVFLKPRKAQITYSFRELFKYSMIGKPKHLRLGYGHDFSNAE
jgi:hypothetical protein